MAEQEEQLCRSGFAGVVDVPDGSLCSRSGCAGRAAVQEEQLCRMSACVV